MMEICVAAPDRRCAHGLMRALAGLFDGSSISFDLASSEIPASSGRGAARARACHEAVEAWLAGEGVFSVMLATGERSHTLVGPAWPAPSPARSA
jgi:hypothetical protein